MDDEGQPDTPRLRALAAPTTVSPAAVVGMLGVVGEAERPPPSGATLAAGLRKRAARRAQLNRDDCKVAKPVVTAELFERLDPVGTRPARLRALGAQRPSRERESCPRPNGRRPRATGPAELRWHRWRLRGRSASCTALARRRRREVGV